MTPRVLLVEDDDERAEWMGRELGGLTLERAPDSARALEALEGDPAYDVIMLDYDIDPGGGGGHHVVAHLQQRSGSAIIIVHSANPLGGPWMAFALKRAGYDTTYAPVFDPESPETWRSILGGEPVPGGWGCPASHPALSLSKKGECALCVLAPKTHWYYEDDQCVLLDCLTCGSPMLVSKHHDEWTDDELGDLIELATEGFPGLQPRLRRGSIPDHPHFHMEDRASNPNIQATGMCFPFAYEKAKAWFHHHFDRTKPRGQREHPDLDNKAKFKVVHGTIIDRFSSSNKPIVHGWVEMGDTILDAQTSGARPEGMASEDYDEMYEREPYAEFTATDAITNCIKYGGEGPWDEELAALLQERDAWMHEGRSPNATDAELQAEVDAEIQAMVAEMALKGALEPDETPTHSPPSGEISPDYSRTLKPWEDSDHLDVHAFADYYGITLRPRIESEGPHQHGQYHYYDCGSHAERIFNKKWGYLGWTVGQTPVSWEEAQPGDEVVWGQGWHRGVVVDPSRKLVESCWGVDGYVFQHPVDIGLIEISPGKPFFGEAQVFPVTPRAGK